MKATMSVGRAARRRRRTTILIAATVVLALGGAGIAVFAGVAPRPAHQAATAVASWTGVHYQGSVTDPAGLESDLELTVAADGSAHGVLRRPFGASAEIGFVAGEPMIKGNQEWWISHGSAEAHQLADRWITDPPAAAAGLGAIDLLAPAALSRVLAAPSDVSWTRAGDREIGDRPGHAWSDGRRHVVVTAGGLPRVLAVDVPLVESPYSLTLPVDEGTTARDEYEDELWETQVEATVTEPPEDELKEVEEFLGAVEELSGKLEEFGEAVQEIVEGDERPAAEECGPRDEKQRAPGPGAPGPDESPGPREPSFDSALPWQPPPPPPPPVPPGPGHVIGEQPAASGDGPSSPGPTGGVNLSSLELRYVRDGASGEGIEYAYSARSAGEGTIAGPEPAATRQASDAFFVWLALPPSSFWVNLGPDEPDRIIDPQLARTDVGRILLEADLEMKKVSARLVHPDTPLGKQFWDSVKHYNGGICTSTRNWIVPGPATVSERDGGLFILDAPLEVHSEAIAPPEAGAEVAGACHGVPPSIVEYNESLDRDLIRPEIERAVNEATEFADLRRVYLSRVAAEWYRNRSEGESTPVGRLINTEDVSPWTSRVPWSPREVFDRYVESLRTYELDVVREEREGDTVSEVRYTVGGVDWTEVVFDEVDPGEIEKRRPGLTSAVAASFERPTTDPQGSVWRGSRSGLPSTWREPGWWALSFIAVPLLVGIVAIGLPAWMRRRRTASIESGEDVP
jgi:hypothetical protein